MVVVGFNLKKILIERKKLVRRDVKVTTKMNISDVKKETFKLTSGKDVISFDFDFSIYYKSTVNQTANLADILFEGNVLYLSDPKDTKKILSDWNKKEIATNIRIRILNTILTKCNIKALILEEDMGLPPHIKLPRFKLKQETEKSKKK